MRQHPAKKQGDTVMNIFIRIKKLRAEKQGFRAYRKRTNALPREYRVVFKEIEAYVWNFSMDGSLDMLSDILMLFESGAADGKSVLDITGNDVTGFCDGLLQEWNSHTWQGQMREKFNERIHTELEKLKYEK
jgi:DNA-binding ferritin-like protein (Dps family)